MRALSLGSTLFLAASLVFANNFPRLVNLRIEGATGTIYEAPILTRGHNITTASGGNHHCDGTNFGANASPGATCTSALADAAHLDRFTFDGTFFEEFDDFFITRIGDSSETATQDWGVLLNFSFTPVGGCQQEVKPFQHVLWAFDAFNAEHFLKLDGPRVIHAGQAATYTVVDGLNHTNVPVGGATLNGQTTNAAGQVTLIFPSPGPRSLKATKSDSIRSNRLDVLVVP
ncbi:hypothetical protein EXIGLDRAFT_758071 [Exidia glandulosa HHB12029]|uniref:Uncharacterized protein n=1 Tax=Exidia glandulosa HHB12029 TaxID=1314781 RepID=A0A165QKF5_EXIGL|nr:hypothetical protein EXIGLDRAFT_758071 [Exidia glandulosa HHB12029]